MKAKVTVSKMNPTTSIELEIDLPDHIEDENEADKYIESIEDDLRLKAGEKLESYVNAMEAVVSKGYEDVNICLYQIYNDIYEDGEVEFGGFVEED